VFKAAARSDSMKQEKKKRGLHYARVVHLSSAIGEEGEKDEDQKASV